MDDLRFNSISVIKGQWAGDYERLHAMEPRLRLERSLHAGLEPETVRYIKPALNLLSYRGFLQF